MRERRWRARAAILFGVFGAARALSSGAAPPHDVHALADALGRAAAGAVAPEDVRWEPSRGVLLDLLVGRPVLFLAAERAGGARDVWRARVRLAPDGRPLGVGAANDLTQTPLGDDHALVVGGARAAFATFAFGQEQSVTALDLAGEPPLASGGLVDRALRAFTNLQQTGTLAGVGRVEVALERPARRLGLALAGDLLAIELLEDGGRVRDARVDLARGEVVGAAPGLHAELARPAPKRAVHWAVDTVRAIPWIGPAPIAWLEEKVFAVRDLARRAAFAARGRGEVNAEAEADLEAAGAPRPPALLDGRGAAREEGEVAAWPPQPIRSIWKTPEAGEGEWVAPKVPFLRRHPLVDASAPPAFLRTFVRPDEQRAYAQVLLVAMDTRQLDLDMEAGSEDPKPLVGANGPGHLPRDPELLHRVAAMFNGAFKTEHGRYGMMVKRRVLLPPQPDAASVVVLRDGRVALGSWPHRALSAAGTADLTGIAGVADEEIVSFRQNLDPLVDQGRLNPSGRAQWGFTLPGTGVQTERSGICVTAGGHLVYAWGDDVGATALAKAMKMAGCTYGMHLDMNPHHTGFVFAAIDEPRPRKYKTQLLSSDMELNPERFVEYSAKDFFFVTVRDPTPAVPLGAATWTTSPGVQPAPAWMPGLFEAKLDGGVELVAVEAGRASWRLRAGTREPDAGAGVVAAPRELAPDDAARVLFAVGLGVATPHRLRGLAVAGKQVLPAHGGSAEAPSGLLVARRGVLAIERGEELGAIGEGDDLAELPLLVDEGAALAAANARGATLYRAALGVARDGRVLLARGVLASHAPLADALRRAGCARVVGLDRGAHATLLFDRAGTASAPRAQYEQSALYAIAAPLRPRAFRFEAREPAAPAPKK